MKRVIFLLVVISFFASCEKYEFDESLSNLKIDIQVKSSDEFRSVDTATIVAGIQLILKAETLNGNPTEWYWEFGDGNNTSGQQVDHLYSEPGTYNVSVTAIDGSNSTESEIVIIAESSTQAVFSLYSADLPNSQGQIRYIVSGSKEYIPDPPVSEDGPFGYQGSDPVSDWDVVQISPDTSSTRVYWEILTHNAVYSQAYGGFDNNNSFTWADMDDSRFFSSSYNHLRVGFLNGQIVEEENFETEVFGSSGDDGENPQIRFEVNETENQMEILINIFNYAEDIDSPKARFKVKREDAWSQQESTTWIGGTGFVKFVTSINGAGEYRLRVEPDQDYPGIYTDMINSDFYNSEENCFVWQLIEVEGSKEFRVEKCSY